MVGFMSQRVLGQFDIGMPTMDRPGIFYVVPNIEAFATDHQIDPPQARLWVALHEVAHSAEFAVRWVRPHFLRLVEEYFAGLEFDPSSIAERLESLERPEDLEQLMQQPGGVAGLLAGPEQRDALDRIQAFMALMEGYADYVMRQAAPNLIPAAPQIAEAIVRRRAEPTQGEQVLQQLMGLELNRQQYRLGVAFCEEVTRRWGEKELARIWESPERLPTLSELEDPVGWAARLL
jgi:putative hydrolase